MEFLGGIHVLSFHCSLLSFLFFACHAKKRNKRKITTDDNPQLPFLHKPTLTMARQLMVHTIRGHPRTSQDAMIKRSLISQLFFF
jgi:hypothetical protein